MLTSYYAISVSITPWSTAVFDFILITLQIWDYLQNVKYIYSMQKTYKSFLEIQTILPKIYP